MKHFFILGRNPKLSHEEVLAFLKARSRTHREVLFDKNILVIETNEGERLDIQEFGGVIKLGSIIFEGNNKKFEEYLDNNEIIPSDKFSYAVFGNKNPEILKEKFKSERKKAMLKHGRKEITFQDSEKMKLPEADFNLFLYEIEGIIYFGNATQNYNYKEVENRDMAKPVRREALAISPRLAKILINLSEAKPHDLLLDPFCGVGGILQEAILKRINVYGIDSDINAIKDAEKNLDWLKKEYKIEVKCTLENINSNKTPDLQFNAIATETPLGKLLKKKPSDKDAEAIIRNFEVFIVPILNRLKKCKKEKAKIAITFPVVRNIRVDVKKISGKTGLKVTMNPVLESRPDQFVSREIVVFE